MLCTGYVMLLLSILCAGYFVKNAGYFMHGGYLMLNAGYFLHAAYFMLYKGYFMHGEYLMHHGYFLL